MNEANNNEILNISTQGEVLIVSFNQASIGGIGGVEKVAETLRSLILQRQPNKMVIDFSSVRFFSSQMLGLLIDIWRRMKDTGGAMRISGINPQLTRVFRITNLDKVFEFHENAESAVAAMQT